MCKFSGLNFMYGKKKEPTKTDTVEAELKSKPVKNDAEIAAIAAQLRPTIQNVKQAQVQIPREILIFWAAMAIIAALVVLTSASQRNKPAP